MKVTRQLIRLDEGYVSHVGGQAAAWLDASDGTTIGRREQFPDEPVPTQVRAAIERARQKVGACRNKADR
jgi:hypothetical protein